MRLASVVASRRVGPAAMPGSFQRKFKLLSGGVLYLLDIHAGYEARVRL